MKLLTFLGTGPYRTTEYGWQGQTCTSQYSPVASCHFLKPDRLVVFLTEGAQQQVYPDFRACLPEGLQVEPISIPLGSDERELWQIFEQVSGCVQPQEEVAFDITHGLRSFPLVGLLVAAFLKSGLAIKLRAVLYGAYDVGQAVSPGKTPVFDLTPMLSLLEWSAAADRFNRTGDARYLGSLLEQQRTLLAKSAPGDRVAAEQAGRLGNLAGTLADISQSLHLNRPYHAMQKIDGLAERIEKAQPALERSAASHPFSLLLHSISDAYTPLALANAAKPENVRAALETQRRMITWYAGREQWVQAVTLAREWLVSWTMVCLGQVNLTQSEARTRVENVINAEAHDLVTAHKAKQPFSPLFLARLPAVETVLGVWNTLADTRNDIDHAGMREQPGAAEDLVAQITRIIQHLNQLPMP
jgi:CRISPR-associated DxTHG motif protein